MYTKIDFGKQLAEKVNYSYDIQYLSNWAHEKYLDNAHQLDKETRAAIMTIIMMEEGDEYILTSDELLKLALDYKHWIKICELLKNYDWLGLSIFISKNRNFYFYAILNASSV